MADIQIWNGQSQFAVGQTPNGFYDNDLSFQIDADKVARYCAQRLGYPMLEVELYSGSFYTCFEEAVTTYGNEVYQYKVRENYLPLAGGATADTLNDAVIAPNLQGSVRIAENYGTEAGVGGNVTKYSGSINIVPGQQSYDLSEWRALNGITSDVEVRKLFYQAPPAILRYFDPYAGTGTGIQSMMDAFDFGSYSPGINFMMMPISFDILKIQAIEFNDQVRKAGYSFEIVHDTLKMFPTPKGGGNIWFEYYLKDEKSSAILYDGTEKVSNVSNVPYENPSYSTINSIGKQWIREYSLALSKELLGYVRGKYGTIPIPGAETTLNAADLLADGRTERNALITQLRDTLNATSRTIQLQKQNEESKNLASTFANTPMVIYVK